MSEDNKNWELRARILSGEGSREDQAAFQDLLENDPDEKNLFEEMSKEISVVEGVLAASSIDMNQAWAKQQEKMKATSGASLLSYAWKVAAAIILAVGFYFLLPKEDTTAILSENEPVLTILPEGSRITLNHDSRLEYEEGFGVTHRKTNFSGEGYFQVQKDKSKPFIIDLGETSIQVLGTEFLVSTDKDGTCRVTVTEGTVLFYDNDGTFSQKLSANQSAEWSNKTLRISEGRHPNILSWYTKHFVFEGTPLPEVLDIVSKAYRVPIEIEGPDLANCMLTAEFKEQKLESILEALRTIYSLSIEEKDRTIKVSGHSCE